MGAGAASVLAFAIVRDLFSGVAGRVRFAYVSATQALAPMFAPVLGSLLYRLTGWRSLFLLLGAAGVLVTAAFGLCFEESLPQERRAVLALRDMLSNYRHILSNRQAVACCLLNALSMGSLLAYITGSSFVFVDLLGTPRTTYGGILLLTASGAMIGSWMSGRLNRALIAPNNILIAGLTLVFTAAGAMLLLSLWGCFTTMTAVPLSLAMTISIGLVTPNVANSLLAPLGKMAGAASALFGCVGMLGGAFSSAVIASIPSRSATPLTVVMTMCSALALSTFFVLYRSQRLETA
jgi:DHA1 family bicyclomycin/chloramphenicol resistance-like MFS transporter